MNKDKLMALIRIKSQQKGVTINVPFWNFFTENSR